MLREQSRSRLSGKGGQPLPNGPTLRKKMFSCRVQLRRQKRHSPIESALSKLNSTALEGKFRQLRNAEDYALAATAGSAGAAALLASSFGALLPCCAPLR